MCVYFLCTEILSQVEFLLKFLVDRTQQGHYRFIRAAVVCHVSDHGLIQTYHQGCCGKVITAAVYALMTSSPLFPCALCLDEFLLFQMNSTVE